MAQCRRVRDVDVGDAAVRGLVDLADVPFDPVTVAQGRFVGDRDDLERPRPGPVGAGADRDLDDLAGRRFEPGEQVIGRRERPALDGEQVLAGLDLRAGLGQRGPKLRRPIQAAVDLIETIAAVLDGIVRAEKAAGNAG
jgi:hypothetical protein